MAQVPASRARPRAPLQKDAGEAIALDGSGPRSVSLAVKQSAVGITITWSIVYDDQPNYLGYQHIEYLADTNLPYHWTKHKDIVYHRLGAAIIGNENGGWT